VIGIRDSESGTRGSGLGAREDTPHAERCDAVGILCDVQGGVLVLCLGNDVLRDDGIGWAIADALEQSSSESRVPSPGRLS